MDLQPWPASSSSGDPHSALQAAASCFACLGRAAIAESPAECAAERCDEVGSAAARSWDLQEPTLAELVLVADLTLLQRYCRSAPSASARHNRYCAGCETGCKHTVKLLTAPVPKLCALKRVKAAQLPRHPNEANCLRQSAKILCLHCSAESNKLSTNVAGDQGLSAARPGFQIGQLDLRSSPASKSALVRADMTNRGFTRGEATQLTGTMSQRQKLPTI